MGEPVTPGRQHLKRAFMLYYYLKIALRNFKKTIYASLINVLGLSAGLTIVFFIAVWVHNELTWDRFHPQAENLYLLASRHESEGAYREYTPFVVRPRPDLFAKFPEVKVNVSLVPLDEATIIKDERGFAAKGIAVTRPFFEAFDFPLVSGSYKPYSDSTKVIFLTERLAYKIFNSRDIVGKVVDFTFDNAVDKGFVIGGILENPPANSSIQFEFIVPYHVRKFWGKMGFDYLLMSPNTDVAAFKEKIAGIGKQVVGVYNSGTTECTIVPLTGIYFHSTFSSFEHGNIRYVWIVMIAGIVILFVVIANHINLTSSLIAGRSRELSVRKIIGSQKFDIYRQFILESFLFICMSLVGAALLSALFLNDFYSIVQKEIDLTKIFSGWGNFLLPGILLVCLFSGIILARFFSGIRPLLMLRGRSSANVKLSAFKDKFMVLQLIVAISGVAVTIGLNAQLDYMMTKDPGYNRENIVKANVAVSRVGLSSKSERARLIDFVSSELSNSSVIVDFDRGSFPTETTNFLWEMEPGKDADNVAMLAVGSNFFKLFDLSMAEGKPVDQYGSFAVLNESAVRAYGISNPIGYKIKNSSWGEYEVSGVVKDFNFESSGLPIKPLVIVCQPYPDRPLIARIAAGRTREGVELLQRLHTIVNPVEEFTYQFFDEEFDRIYRRDIVITKIFRIVAVIAVAISMLGIFSLILVFTQEKTREIGIRKVFGAHVLQIAGLIGYHFMKRLLLAFAIATAVSWFALHKWLENFADKIELTWSMFALAGILVFALAQLTVGWQIFRAARANPVDSLRYD